MIRGLHRPWDLFMISSTFLVIWSDRRLTTYPYPLERLFCSLCEIGLNLKVPLMRVFLTWFSLVTPPAHLSIFISALCNGFSCCFFSSQHLAPYVKASRTAALYVVSLYIVTLCAWAYSYRIACRKVFPSIPSTWYLYDWWHQCLMTYLYRRLTLATSNGLLLLAGCSTDRWYVRCWYH